MRKWLIETEIAKKMQELTLRLLGDDGVSSGGGGLGFGGGRGATGRTVPVAGRDAGEDGAEAEDVEPAVTPIAQHQLRGRIPGPARLAPHIVVVAGSGGLRSWPWRRPRAGPATELPRGAHLCTHARSEMAGGGNEEGGGVERCERLGYGRKGGGGVNRNGGGRRRGFWRARGFGFRGNGGQRAPRNSVARPGSDPTRTRTRTRPG